MRIAVAGATGLVGRPLVIAARGAGHEVVELSRARGVDLTRGPGPDLTGVDAVVDVTNAPGQDEGRATAFFTAVAEHLGEAATAAGVRRTVVLSIIGVDQTPDDGYYVAKLAHERTTGGRAPGPRVLRAAQFHEFPGQVLGSRRRGDHASIPDMPVQTVELAEVVRLLLAMATGDDRRALVELAGPRPERLPDLVRRLDPTVDVVEEPVSAAVAAGALRPGPHATIAGIDFDTWLTARPH